MGQSAAGRTFRKRAFTSRSGVKLAFTELGFGAAPLGNLYRPMTEREARETLEASWLSGYRYFDTAPLYGLGLSETRLNSFLRGKSRETYLISTKVGRLLEVCPAAERSRPDHFHQTPSRREVFDYSYDGILRSLEFSLERLGLDRIDILYVHDIDFTTHGSVDASNAHIDALMKGGFKALTKLREEGVISAFGAGVNDWEVAETLAKVGDFDLFLLAGRYTLLEQAALESFLPLCVARKIGVVIGGPFNSGILASGSKPGARYNYMQARPDVLDTVKRIEAVCKAHGVKLAEAALRFPLGHPAVVSVIPGAQKRSEVKRNEEILSVKIPTALWRDLKAKGLLRADAPTPR